MPKRRAETAASTWSRASIAAIPVLKAIAVARRRPISSSAVPREEFVPIEVQSYAYLNRLNQFHRRNLFSMAISVWSTLSITAILAK